MRIGELARRTGVGVSTLRAWEHRFGFPVPTRSSTGQRLYAEADVEAVEAVLRLVSGGLTLPAAITRVASGGPGALPEGEGEALLLGQVLQAADQGVWVSKDGRTRYANRRMADMMGYSVDELVAIPVLDFFASDELPTVRERTARVRGGDPLRFTTQLRRADGSMLMAEITTTPLVSPAGRYDGAVSLVNDVTARKEADTHARIRASLLDSVADAVMAATPDGKIAYLNTAAEQLFGWRSSEVVGREAIAALAAPETAQEAEQVLSALLDGKRYAGRQRGTRRDGRSFAAHVTAWSVRDDVDAIVGMVAIIGDQTERTQIARATRKRELQAETIALLGAQALRQRAATLGGSALVVTEAVDATRRLLGADLAVVFDVHDDTSELRQRAASPDAHEEFDVPAGSRSFAGYITLARKAVVVANTKHDGRFDYAPTGTDAGSAIGAPIFGPDGLVGVLAAYSATRSKFDDADAQFIQGMANIVGTALL